MLNPSISGLEVSVSVCPYLSNTVISRYVFDVVQQLGHDARYYTLEFAAADGSQHSVRFQPDPKHIPEITDVILGSDWLDICQSSTCQLLPFSFFFFYLTFLQFQTLSLSPTSTQISLLTLRVFQVS